MPRNVSYTNRIPGATLCPPCPDRGMEMDRGRATPMAVLPTPPAPADCAAARPARWRHARAPSRRAGADSHPGHGESPADPSWPTAPKASQCCARWPVGVRRSGRHRSPRAGPRQERHARHAARVRRPTGHATGPRPRLLYPLIRVAGSPRKIPSRLRDTCRRDNAGTAPRPGRRGRPRASVPFVTHPTRPSPRSPDPRGPCRVPHTYAGVRLYVYDCTTDRTHSTLTTLRSQSAGRHRGA